MSDTEEIFYIVPKEQHNELVRKAYSSRGFNDEECDAAARFSAYATQHGIRTHNALKALHLDDLFGSKAGVVSPLLRLSKKNPSLQLLRFGIVNIAISHCL